MTKNADSEIIPRITNFLPKEYMSEVQRLLDSLHVPHFEATVRIPNAPDLDARVTDSGFSVSGQGASFTYRAFDPLQAYSAAREFMPENLTIGYNFPEPLSNSTLTITGTPNVEMRTKYKQEPGQDHGVLTVLDAREVDPTRIFTVYARTPAERELIRVGQEAANKALVELHIDGVYRQRMRMVEEARKAARLPSGMRTLNMYLAR